jgi:beta-mannanase
VLLGFAHEPGALLGDGAGRSGDETAYVDAWRHMAERFAEVGADNVSWVWTLTAYSFRTGDPESLYPGDDIVDWVGVDGYVNVACPWLDVPWSSWTEAFTPAVEFAEEHRKPLVVAEFGLREDSADPQRKSQWLADAADEIRRMPQIKAVVSFDSQESCSSPIDSSAEAVQGYREMGSADWLSDPAPVRRQ